MLTEKWGHSESLPSKSDIKVLYLIRKIMEYSEMIKEYRQRNALSQEDMAKVLGVSFSSVNRWENGHFQPTPRIRKKLLELYCTGNKPIFLVPTVKTCSINNRRYLGNKYKLLPFIRRVVEANCPGIQSFADIFSGTGSVASAFSSLRVITNDILYSNYICNYAWFGAESIRKEILINMISYFNSIQVDESNYMTVNFSDTYFSREDCSKIGYIREFIETKFLSQEINSRERAVLICSLLYAMDHIAKTCGHYDAYIRHATYDKHLILSYPDVPQTNNERNECYNEDANELVRHLSCDLVYIDPPYNSRQYCDAYHLLENVAKWEKPEVFGVAKKMNRKKLKSKYCTNSATSAFADLVGNIQAKYILLSYNNMGEKGNLRSNAKITDSDIRGILGRKGKVLVFSQSYKAFSTGKSDIKDNEERLFLCVCGGKSE